MKQTAVEWLIEEIECRGIITKELRIAFQQAKEMEKKQETMYSEREVLHLSDSLWDRLDVWYNEKIDKEFNLIHWFNQCELKKK